MSKEKKAVEGWRGLPKSAEPLPLAEELPLTEELPLAEELR